MQAERKSDLLGRVMGILILLVGVGMLGFVFWKAYELFQLPPSESMGLRFTGDPKKDPGGAQIGTQFGHLLFRIAYLFLMSIAGSLLAQKGINLYFSALHGYPISGKPGAEPQVQEPVTPNASAEKSAQT